MIITSNVRVLEEIQSDKRIHNELQIKSCNITNGKQSTTCTSELAMRKAKQGSVDRITYTRATGLLIQRQRKGKTKKKKSKEGRHRQLQDLLNHDIHQPSAVQTSYRPVQTHTSWSGLSPRCTAIPVADHTTATNRAGPSISAPTGP